MADQRGNTYNKIMSLDEVIDTLTNDKNIYRCSLQGSDSDKKFQSSAKPITKSSIWSGRVSKTITKEQIKESQVCETIETKA